MVTKSVITRLSELGLSGYEAKAYLALTRDHPATPYEIAKSSGVPTSKIYEVLGKLLERRIIFPLNEDPAKTKRYIPMHPDEVLNQHLITVEGLVGSLKRDFLKLGLDQEFGYISNISDYDYLLNKAIRMIEEARHIILVSLWPEELDKLEGPLRKAEARGIRIAIVHFGIPKKKVGQVYYHPIEDTLYAEQGGRGFVLVVDSHQVLMGNISHNGSIEGAWSHNRGFATLAEDYIKHDVYITKIIKRFEKELINRFGEKYVLLRNVFQDDELGEDFYQEKGVTRSHESV
jgi:HTH-type transcriptional regulator, sugar sensing transcriptional regulator